jgi:hypothetical protein
MHSGGVTDYVQILDCLFCQECRNTCQATTGCPASCESGDCTACQNCAFGAGGLCEDDLDICLANPECLALDMCYGGCSDQTCYDNCSIMHSDGIADWNAIYLCGICQECPNDCSPNACP